MGASVADYLLRVLTEQSQRLREGGVAGDTLRTSARVVDPEDALRILMTSLLPRISGGRAKPGDAQDVATLLSAIGPMAGRSLRFLDAFNNFWSLARTRPFLAAAEGWPSALAAYSSALDSYRLGKSFAEEQSDWARSFNPPAWPLLGNTANHGPVRKVLVLADNPFTGWRILREVSKVDGIEAHVLICRSNAQSAPAFFVRQAAGIALAVRGSAAVVPSVLRRLWTWLPYPLHDERVIDWIRNRRFDVGLHGMGVIYRKSVLDAFGHGLLNAHIGYLPSFRGRSVVEWSLLAEAPLGATVFFIDDGIDTGERLVVWRPAPRILPSKVDDLRRILFDSDGANYAAALQALRQPSLYRNDLSRGWRFYVMSDLLRGVSQQALDLHRCSSVAVDARTATR